MPHQLFVADLQARDIYHELKIYFYREHSNVTWEEFLTTKFGLWIYMRSSTDDTLYGSAEQWKKVAYCLKWNVFNVFSPVETTHLCIGFFHHNI